MASTYLPLSDDSKDFNWKFNGGWELTNMYVFKSLVTIQGWDDNGEQ